MMEIPSVYRKNFETKPEQALRDLAGIPPAAGDPFISLTYKIDEAVERWNESHDNLGSPVTADSVRPLFEDWFKANNSLKRAIHIDTAYSSKGDALGMAMGHVEKVIEYDGEMKPYIVFDFLLRIKAPPGNEILLQEVRRIVYDIRDDLGFKIACVSMDGFQSTETKQQLRKRKFRTEYVSVDRSKLPYEDLRDALYEDRIEFPPYVTYLNRGDDERVQIAVKELSELEEDDRKIDHPESGSKDVADAMAGVVYRLMGDRSYRRNVRSLDDARERREELQTGTDGYQVGHYHMPGLGDGGLRAPVPPTQLGGLSVMPGSFRRD